MSELDALLNLTIIHEDMKQGDAGLAFEGGISLAIYNKFFLKNSSSRTLVGQQIKAVKEASGSIMLQLSEGGEMIIYLSESAYTGPEALQMIRPDKPIVIWN